MLAEEAEGLIPRAGLEAVTGRGPEARERVDRDRRRAALDGMREELSLRGYSPNTGRAYRDQTPAS